MRGYPQVYIPAIQIDALGVGCKLCRCLSLLKSLVQICIVLLRRSLQVNLAKQSGICPSCAGKGEVGAPCKNRVCSLRNYSHIHAEYASNNLTAPIDPLVGLMLGDYLIVQPIGSGTFGKIYLSIQLPIGMKAAVKLLDLDRLPAQLSDTLKEKFRSEASALAMLQHPNILRLLHYGHLEDRPYLVTDYIEGGNTLEDEVARRAVDDRNFSVVELTSMLRQLLDGLGAAHKLGIVHRDVKPDNIMLQDVVGHPRLVRILDFGLAKFIYSGDMTQSTSGTPDYMAPEQLNRERLGPWTDLYAVGIIAFELMTGKKPFAADTIQEIFYLKLNESYDPVSQLADLTIPTEVTDFLRRAMARNFEKRYQNVDAMLVGLKKALGALAADPANTLSQVTLTGLFEGVTTTQAPTRADLKAEVSGKPVSATKGKSDDAFRSWLEQEQQRLEREARALGKK